MSYCRCTDGNSAGLDLILLNGACIFQRELWLRFLKVMKQRIPADVRSIVIQSPTGTACSHGFTTRTVELPIQQRERVTISLAAPSCVNPWVGPFQFSPKPPDFNPRRAHLSYKPQKLPGVPAAKRLGKEWKVSLYNPSILFLVLALLATGDATSGIINTNLARFLRDGERSCSHNTTFISVLCASGPN